MEKIDNLDKKIILELFEDGRQSNVELAKKLQVSKEVIRYRLNNLFENKVIEKIIPIMNFSKFGYNIYRLQLKLNPISDNEEKKLIDYIKQFQNITWVDKILGKWDLVILLYIKDSKEFYSIYDNICFEYGDLIDEKYFSIIYKIHYFPPNYLINSNRVELISGIDYDVVEIEDNAKLILAQLFEDGRKSLVDIALKLNVSVNTAKYHLDFMKKNKLILGFQPVLNIEKLGFEHFKMLLSLANPKDRKQLKNELKVNPHIVHLTNSIGFYDLEFECEFEKSLGLLKLIEEINKKFKIKNYEIIYDNEEFLLNQLSLKILQ